MKVFKLFTMSLLLLFFTGCGGDKSKNDTDKTHSSNDISSEDIRFEEKQNGDLEITWNKAGNSYKVLAIEKNGKLSKQTAQKTTSWVVIYEASEPGKISIVCRPDQLGSSTVTYQCTIKKNNILLNPVNFVLYSTDGKQEFVLGVGNSYDSAKFERVEEQISINGLDIDIKYGEYKLLDTQRTFDEYHGYFLLLKNGLAKGREFSSGTQMFPDYELAWGYDRNTKQLILDNRESGGGYAEGQVFGNSDKVSVEGFWADGRALSATLSFMSDSKEFTLNSKSLPQYDSGNDYPVSHF